MSIFKNWQKKKKKNNSAPFNVEKKCREKSGKILPKACRHTVQPPKGYHFQLRIKLLDEFLYFLICLTDVSKLNQKSAYANPVINYRVFRRLHNIVSISIAEFIAVFSCLSHFILIPLNGRYVRSAEFLSSSLRSLQDPVSSHPLTHYIYLILKTFFIQSAPKSHVIGFQPTKTSWNSVSTRSGSQKKPGFLRKEIKKSEKNRKIWRNLWKSQGKIGKLSHFKNWQTAKKKLKSLGKIFRESVGTLLKIMRWRSNWTCEIMDPLFS